MVLMMMILTHTSVILDHVEMMTNIGEILVVDLLLMEQIIVVKNFGSDFITYDIENEPLNFRQAMNSSLPESRYWKGPLKSEIDCIVEFVRHYARMRLDMMIENMLKIVCDYYFKL